MLVSYCFECIYAIRENGIFYLCLLASAKSGFWGNGKQGYQEYFGEDFARYVVSPH